LRTFKTFKTSRICVRLPVREGFDNLQQSLGRATASLEPIRDVPAGGAIRPHFREIQNTDPPYTASVRPFGFFLPVRTTRGIVIDRDDKQARQQFEVGVNFFWEAVAYASECEGR
jgi:hypothetical protein